jgi:hypothetical protein
MRQQTGLTSATTRERYAARATAWSAPLGRAAPRPASLEQAPVRQPQFKPGQRVQHGVFGEGVVIKTELADDDEYVSVAFPGQGVKKLMASFARLQLLRS